MFSGRMDKSVLIARINWLWLVNIAWKPWNVLRVYQAQQKRFTSSFLSRSKSDLGPSSGCFISVVSSVFIFEKIYWVVPSSGRLTTQSPACGSQLKGSM
jgi:hypothetical protein